MRTKLKLLFEPSPLDDRDSRPCVLTTIIERQANTFSSVKLILIPTALHRSGRSSHTAGRTQGDVMELWTLLLRQAAVALPVERAIVKSKQSVNQSRFVDLINLAFCVEAVCKKQSTGLEQSINQSRKSINPKPSPGFGRHFQPRIVTIFSFISRRGCTQSASVTPVHLRHNTST